MLAARQRAARGANPLIKHDEENPGKPACLLRDSGRAGFWPAEGSSEVVSDANNQVSALVWSSPIGMTPHDIIRRGQVFHLAEKRHR